MKTSCLRLAAFAASLLVASVASVRAACDTIVWNNWNTADQYGWDGVLNELYANDSGTPSLPDDNVGILKAVETSNPANQGGGIYGTFYYTFFDNVTFTLTPGSFNTPVKKVCLRVNRTYNPVTNGVNNVVIYINGNPTPITPASIIDDAGDTEDDFIICWNFCNLKEPVTSFYIQWTMIPHSTFDEVILTQCNSCEDNP